MIDTTYTQCKLTKDGQSQVAWIPTRGAKIGYFVELKPSNEFWRVNETYGTIPEKMVKDNERNYISHREATDI